MALCRDVLCVAQIIEVDVGAHAKVVTMGYGVADVTVVDGSNDPGQSWNDISQGCYNVLPPEFRVPLGRHSFLPIVPFATGKVDQVPDALNKVLGFPNGHIGHGL